MTQSIVIRDVEVWQADTIIAKTQVLIEDGIFKGTRDDLPTNLHNCQVIDGRGLVLMPCGIDPQVHLRVPGQAQKETAASGLAAALRGGIAALLTMPNTKPVIDDIESVALAKEELKQATANTGVTVLLSAAITKNQKGQELVDFSALQKVGIAAFTDDGVGVMDDELMAAALAYSQESGIPILQHAEMVGHGGVLAPGPMQEKTKVKAYPAAAEVDMVARDLKLLGDYPRARYHVLHVSSKETLELIRSAKAKGLNASCEVSPHHLYFCNDDIDDQNTAFKMNPPLRTAADREALQHGLADGTVDFVATDHAPHEARAKDTNLAAAAYGTTGLETSLQVLLSLVAAKKLQPKRLVEVFAQQPAKFLGLDNSYGQFTVGKPIRAVLVDTKVKTKISADHFVGLSSNSCFIDSTLDGSIEKVFIGDLLHDFA